MALKFKALLASKKKPGLALFYIILGAIAIGFAPIFVRYSQVGPIATGFWRVAIAFPLLTLLSLGQGSVAPDTTKNIQPKDYLLILFAGILFGCDLATWHTSIQYTTIANSTLLANFSPILIALYGWLILRRPPKKRLVWGLFFAIVGVAILINPRLNVHGTMLKGDLLAFITSFFYAGYLLVLNRARQKFTAFSSMAISTFASTITLLIITYISAQSFLPQSTNGWLILIGLAIFSHILGQGLIAYALPYIPVTFASITLLVQPMVAAIAGWLLFAEHLTLLQMLGILIALLGIYLAKQTT